MNWFTIISTLIFYVWMFVIAYLLWRGQTRQAVMQQTLVDLATRSSETVHTLSLAVSRLTAFVDSREKEHDSTA